MKLYYNKIFVIFLLIFFFASLIENIRAGEIPADHVPSNKDILNNLQKNVSGLSDVYKLIEEEKYDSAAILLAKYYKNKLSERFFFNWQNFENRFEKYKSDYPNKESKHYKLAQYQFNTYAPETKWILPFKNLNGEEVTAYELRHLSRQQKSMDMALVYYYSNKTAKYYDYFIRQVKDLNRAFKAGEYDDEGNGIYEVFRAGKRINNWLFVHNAYLASEIYSSEDQFYLIKTFLHHGAQFYKRIKKFKYGNHQTKGLVALFQLSVLFPEFEDSQKWLEKSLAGLEWHITNEINDDGFQFERSVHYHVGDILNYFRVFQLAKLNNIDLPQIFTTRLKSMFDAMISLAQPNRYLPVLQDDTDSPFAEKNDVSSAFTIGTLMFENPEYRYFSEDKIPASIYWLLSNDQLEILDIVKPQPPNIGSSSLPNTGYYSMRSGWDENDLYMTITAGLSEHKPDHQHGDMLGLVAYAHGKEILPNYQVRYKFDDYVFFKNSFVKNVALVDSIPLGRGWNPNRGKSGFGKWKTLPKPKVLSWITDEKFDYFAGSHDSYDSINVKYNRTILFIKDKFWVVIDKFVGNSEHTYQQIWQGLYDKVNDRIMSGKNTELEILQLNQDLNNTEIGRFREKGNAIYNSFKNTTFEFFTVLNPYKSMNERIELIDSKQNFRIKNWQIKDNKYRQIIEIGNVKTDARLSIINKTGEFYLIELSQLDINGKSIQIEPVSSIFYSEKNDKHIIEVLGYQNLNIIADDINSVVNLSDGTVINSTVSPATEIEIRLK